MSEHLHPDIDSLNAFVEGVLQEDERLQCLAHLAECDRCREVVFLAQEPRSVAVAPRPAFSWRRWFAPIPVLAATAVVCIALVAIWLSLRSRIGAPTRDVAVRVTQPAQSPYNRVEAQIPKPSVARKVTQSARARRKPESSAEEKPPLSARANTPAPVAKDARPESAPAAPSSIQPPPDVSVTATAPPPIPFSIPQVQPPPAIAEARSLEPASEISGTVTDASGAVVGGANVQLRQLAGTMTRNARTDTSGAFKFTELPAGRYELRIEMRGFREAVQQINVHAQETAAVRPELQVGATAETVEVTAAVPTIQTESSRTVGKSRRKQAPEPRPLPSGQPPTITVTRGKVRLAVDSVGALFFSGNAGKSWKAIKPLWPGKVVELVSPAEPPQPATVGFQLKTDSGSIWLSRNGRHWYAAQPQP